MGDAAKQKASLQARLAAVDLKDVILNSVETHVPSRNRKGSGGWLNAPAMLMAWKTTDEELLQAAWQKGLRIEQVDRVGAAYVASENVVLIWPEPADSPDAIEVKRNNAKLIINLITVLGPAKKRVPVGYSDRYDIHYLEESPFGPAVYFHLGRRRQRKVLPDPRKKAAAAKAKAKPQIQPDPA